MMHKLMDWFQKHAKSAVYIIIVLVVLSFFYVHSENSFWRVTDEYENVYPVELESHIAINQDISMGDAKLSAISLLFGTYNRVNEGSLIVTLYEDDNEIQRWAEELSSLGDNSYAEFYLDEPVYTSSEHDYRLTVEAVFEGNNSIALYQSLQEDGSESICYVLQFFDYIHQRVTIALFALILVVTAVLSLMALDERLVMSIIVVALGLVYFFVIPVGMVPDESTHFYRAYEISRGHMISEHVGEEGVGGNYLPNAIVFFEDDTAVIDWSDKGEVRFANTALYSPTCYIPQSIGILIADRFVSDNVQTVFYAGRLGGFIACIALCLLSINIIPYGRKIVFLIMLFPMSLQEMISMSPDGLTISMSLFLLSYVLYLSYKSERLKLRDYIILAIACLMLSMLKIVYVVLLFLILLIPKEKFGGMKKSLVFKTAVITLACLVNAIWLGISSGFLVEFQPGVDSAEQVKFILLNIPEYYLVVVRTIIENGIFYVGTMIGSNMGPLTIPVTGVVWVAYLVLFVYVTASSQNEHSVRQSDIPIMILVFLACVALIFTSLYVQWTPYRNDIINGVQGRYFIPIIGLPTIASMSLRKRSSENSFGIYTFILALVLNGMTLLDILSFTASF